MTTVGERIKSLRERNNLSQTELADKIGVSKQTLYKYENNIITNIPSDKVEAIATLCGVSPAYIMGWDKEGSGYYLNDDARELAQFLFENPNYRVLFDASRKIKRQDLEIVKELLDRFS